MGRLGGIRCWLAGGSWLLATTPGCGLESGYEELGRGLSDRGEPQLEVPGRRLVEGDFESSRLEWAGQNGSGSPVIAVVDDDGMMSFVRSDLGERCLVGPAQYMLGFEGGRPEQVAIGKGSSIFSYFESWDAVSRRGTLKFAEPNCTGRAPELSEAGLPLALSDSSGFVVLAGESELWALDPWAATRTMWSGEIQGLAKLGDRICSIESGVFVCRDLATDTEVRFGSEAREFSANWDILNSRTAYVDGDGLHVVGLDQGTDELTATDACEPRWFSHVDDDLLTYLSPCAERRLVVADLGTGERRETGAIVSSGPVVRSTASGNRLYYVSEGEPGSGVGTLHGVQISTTSELEPDLTPVRLVENASLDRLVSWDEHQAVIVDWDGDSGRLLYVRTESDVVELARDVAWVSWLYALSNFDGQTGDFVRIDPLDLTLTTLAGGVPLASIGEDYLLSDFDGQSGTLIELRWDPLAQIAQPIVVAERVPLQGYRTLQNFEEIPRGFGYLTDFDPATGTGRLRVRVGSETLDFGAGVAGFGSVNYPFPGLTYRVRGGERAGIWYAIIK